MKQKWPYNTWSDGYVTVGTEYDEDCNSDLDCTILIASLEEEGHLNLSIIFYISARQPTLTNLRFTDTNHIELMWIRS